MTVDTLAAVGRWPDILSALGVERRFLSAKNGPCPMCGGKDRWRFDDKEQRGTWFCNSCGSGDGFRLVELINRCSFQEAGRMVESVIGSARIQPPRERICEDEARAKANDIWRESCSTGAPLSLYLEKRRINLPYGHDQWSDIRFHPSLSWGASEEKYPVMVAMVRDAAGRPATLHRTYLSGNGGKAAVARPRLMAGGLSVPKGAAVRLCEAGKKLGIGEGLETCMAASLMFDGLPVWSALNADNLVAWHPPEGVEHVVVLGDNDVTFTGQAAAYTLAKRLALAGNGSRYVVTVAIPPRAGEDWADVWMREAP